MIDKKTKIWSTLFVKQLASVTVNGFDLKPNMYVANTKNICITFVHLYLFDVGPALYKCYANILCLMCFLQF